MKKKHAQHRDGALKSPWQSLPAPVDSTAVHNPETVYDCLIIGAGITGISTALLVQTAGKKVIVADAHTAGFGTTGGTSAHINTFADTTYKEAESAFGAKGAQLFADAINDGFDLIKQNISTYGIDCDYETKSAYLYAENEEQKKQLDDIFESSDKVGIHVNYTEDLPGPFTYVKALHFDKQAQFHPLKYLNALKKTYLDAGGILLSHTKIENVETRDNIHRAIAGETVISAEQVVYATHIPPKITSFSFRCAPYRSYVLGVKLKGNNYPDALIYDMEDPYHYIRTHQINGEPILLAGGEDHKTGHNDPEKAFSALERFVRKNYSVSSVRYKWSSQYYIPSDGFPYIGQMPGVAKGIYCATGYNGNGMMLGSIAGKILSDLVNGRKSKYEAVFSPARIRLSSGLIEAVKENADVAYHFIADRFNIHETDSVKRIRRDSGKVVEVKGEKIAVYCDANGNIYSLNPVCTHARCIVSWNQEEKSWDCPCHGARYDIHGRVLNGPADKDLQKIDISQNNGQ